MAEITTSVGVCNLAMDRLGAEPVSDISSPSTPEEEACERVYNQLLDEMLMGLFATERVDPYNWQFAKRHLMLQMAKSYAESDYDEITITGITAADPAVVSAAAHGFTDDWLVYIAGVVGMTEMNGRFVRVANKAAGTFECYDLDSSDFTAYVSGGTAIRMEALYDWQNGYVYDVPTDFLKVVDFDTEGIAWELVGSGNSRRFLVAEEDPVLVYIAQVTTVAQWPIPFIRALADRIAYELGPTLSKGNIEPATLMEIYVNSLRSAIATEAKNVDPKSLVRDKRRLEEAGGFS